jgi:hypothetical protein
MKADDIIQILGIYAGNIIIAKKSRLMLFCYSTEKLRRNFVACILRIFGLASW